MNTKLIHTLNDSVELHHNNIQLFRYVYAPTFDPWECRKPFMHPIRTLAGNEITCFRPHDHVWHKGIQMTMANLSGQNFWGGFSYVRDQGYVRLDNVGQMQHIAWDQLDERTLQHRLNWITAAGATWIDEQRTIHVAEINEKEGYWPLDWTMRLTNSHTEPLKFGSPTTEGRPNAGYGGLFWRGPRSFTNGQILAAGNLEGPDTMGQRAPWLAYIGTHDGSADKSTLLFMDHPDNPNYPNKWFVRSKEFACAAFSFSFDEEVELAPQQILTLRYRTVFADGEWSRDRLEAFVSQRGTGFQPV